jgi:predicted alpha-1,6-mannanase (GH76 family)
MPAEGAAAGTAGGTPDWAARADEAYDVLVTRFYNPRRGLFRVATGCRCWPLSPWHYWWQAHALDCVLDAVERGRPAELDRAAALVRGVLRRNGNRICNDYADDMAWMALALSRAGELAGPAAAAGLEGTGLAGTGLRVPGLEVPGLVPGLDVTDLVGELWRKITRLWDQVHGGIRWRRGDTYTNAAANGPAAILAVRRYRATGRVADLGWARRITGWLAGTLIDPATGVVFDGIHPGSGTGPNKERYTYNHGTVAAAFHELAAVTGDPAHRARALAVARAGLRWPDGGGSDGTLPDEGGGDRALFKGIYARYAAELADPEVTAALAHNGERAWAARTADGLFGPSWTTRPPAGRVELSSQLSAVLLLGALARG